MIDFHTHSLLSDGALIPSELVRRAIVAGYTAIAITDHADESNIDLLIKQLRKVTRQLNGSGEITVIPGVELTHIPLSAIPQMVKKARLLGARIVIGHGETLSEPVEEGTNAAFIKAGVDILAHPGIVSEGDCRLAAKKGVSFEITSRHGHSLSNGHVAANAKEFGVKLVINTDSHSPSDLITDAFAEKVVIGSGLDIYDFRRIQENAEELLEKIR